MNNNPRRFGGANQIVGAVVILSLGLLVLAALQAGVLRRVLHPVTPIRIIMPEGGFAGLQEGAPVEIMGTRAGEVTRLDIDPTRPLAVEADIDRDMFEFLRRGSRAIIRKQYGIAGPTFLEILLGSGEPLNPDHAVIEAEAGRAPTDNVDQLIDDVRAKVFPLIDDTHRTVRALADFSEALAAPDGKFQKAIAALNGIVDRIQRGEGLIGRILADDVELANNLEAALAEAKQAADQIRVIIGELEKASKDVSTITAAVSKQSKQIPEIIANTNTTMASLKTVMQDLGRSTPELPGIAKNVNAATAKLPVLLEQVQQTTEETEKLVRQLRSLWILGGGGDADPAPGRLPAGEARP